jgi:SSS family solute:Na+ symporter
MFRVHAGVVDYAIIAVYFAVVLGIGFAARRAVHSGLDFFPSGRSLPAWITGLAFIAANGAKYGAATVHFYGSGRCRRWCSSAS